jgi:cyclic beta-1,2-glucan synthetase
MSRLRDLIRPGARSRVEAAEDLLTGPIHGDLLGIEHLAERARNLARGQSISASGSRHYRARLLERLDSTRRVLDAAYTRIAHASGPGKELDPSGEWLLDNYHVIQEHVAEVREALPRDYYRELPELLSGTLSGYPRIYEIAIALISHSEGRIDLDNVDLFVEAFQQVQTLSIGELWAVPAMLRLALIENIRRMSLRTVQRLDEIAEADRWARQIVADTDAGGTRLLHTLRDVLGTPTRLTPIFVARLLAQLRLTTGASPALIQVDRWLENEGLHPDDAVARASQRVVHTQIMMANSITSLRSIGRRDWRGFVERQSAMDAVLRTDPSGDYSRMSFTTRDRYRHVVERLARSGRRSEVAVAETAVGLARAAQRDGHPDQRQHHVGHWIVGDGCEALEQQVGGWPPLGARMVRALRKRPDLVLVGGLALLTIFALIAVNLLAGISVALVAWPIILLFTFLPAWDIGISTINQLVTAVLPPRLLPSLDLRDGGIPAEFHTVVVVPTLFSTPADVEEALANLEVVYLANRGGHLHFAVLSDFTDAPAEVMPGDAEILAEAQLGIRALNARYADASGSPFFLLHRPRRWNAQQGTWMGWERKRGKLAEFNKLLRGGAQEAFTFLSGDVAALQSVRYVITLDADTMLPQGAATALVGTIAHPLNRAIHDPDRGRVVAGYGILQPRVAVSLDSAQRSRFAAILSGQPGVDPYTTAVSDVYQDLYGEGSYTGKGIYDVDAFRLATRGRFPENTLLSHDLIEGNYARAGLTTGITVYDDMPAGYLAHSRRKHRWIRGDWQLLPWLQRRVPGPDGPEPNRLSLLSRWKVLDNMRRSTVEISQLALLFAGWTVLAGSPLRWTLLALGAVAAPWVVSILLALLRPPVDKSWRAYYHAVGVDALNGAQQFALAVTFLPHQVWLSIDAIGRTLWRLLVSRSHLLEWVPAAQSGRQTRETLAEHWRAMWPAVATAVAAGLVILVHAFGLVNTGSMPSPKFWHLVIAVTPFLALWLASPAIATRLGPSQREPESLDDALRSAAHRYAEHHWRYFDQYVSEDTHWLAPDNVQFDPDEVVAMRTSPTNIGLQLLATVSAHDLGWLPITVLVERLELTFATLERLQRFRGHFFNWYALDDLHVLGPAYVSTVDSGNLAGHLLAFREACRELAAGSTEPGVAPRLLALSERAYQLADQMDFSFLFDAPNRLLSIGYHPDSNTLDTACYDLLASEARLASFVAIAKGDLPAAAWFRLGRQLIRHDGVPMMVSWSGSMFEYLMPVLVMRSFQGTLLHQSDRGAVHAHMAHGRQHDVPWGVSESAYNVRDRELTYQYRAFGVPEIALKRGLARDLVVAPYASALAAMIEPVPAIRNLAELERLGALGPHGFWDALDFSRRGPGARFALVRTVMSHHAGMTLVALTNVLRDNTWQRRFHEGSLVRAAELLLQERVPRRLQVQASPRVEEPDSAARRSATEPPVTRHVTTIDSARPRVGLLGDLPFTVMVSHAGGGWSRHDRIAVTRWRPDATRDDTGQFCFVRDLTTGKVWSVGHQPTGVAADRYSAEFAPDRITLHRIDGRIETRTEIVVVAADEAEVRRVTLTNHSRAARRLELTSYAEVVMGPPDADAAHPAFANLFVETEWHAWCSAITARRRPRRASEPAPWCVHLVDAGPHRVDGVSCETDRSRFIGRGRTIRMPAALDQAGPLSGTVGAVLDPVVSIRTTIEVPPGESVSVAFTTLVAASRERAFELADRYHDSHATQRALDLAWMAAQVDLNELGLTSAQVANFQELAGDLIYGSEDGGPPVDELRRNRGSQALLWNHGISGDLPILLATLGATQGLPTLRELFMAHRYLRRRGLLVDMVVVVSEPHNYFQQLRQAVIDEMVAASDALLVDQPGGVFIRRRDGFSTEEFLMLSATARLQVTCDGRPLSRIAPVEHTAEHPAALGLWPFRGAPPPRPTRVRAEPTAPDPANVNGFGHLEPDGGYHIRVTPEHVTPAPWCNVLANPRGGFLVSERGAGCTWAGNAYFYRLTPWHNDPVCDPVCDAIYLHDKESGELWSATPAPVPGHGAYDVRHAPGESRFAHRHGDIVTELVLGMPVDDPVKLSALRITNRGSSPRTLTITAYAEWTLGVHRAVTAPHVRTWFAEESRALMAQNRFEAAFAEEVAFLAISEAPASHSADRRAFLGRHGTLADPVALRADTLDRRTGSGLDPCGALQCVIRLLPGEHRDLAVLLGAAPGEGEARDMIARYGTSAKVRDALDTARTAWQQRLGVVQVQTPDTDFDAMLNHWSLYQALSSRMWGRMGLYQSSGAFGFRDQLQDVMAFVYAEPQLAREHLLRAASRQFLEGDVQHWWHPHSGRGVRTRFSDDLAWLPFATCHYVEVTGDHSVLDAVAPFLTMRALEPHEHELYELPQRSAEQATLYEHCLRAVRRACTRGPHGLPLIGTGDWNDGFSRIGEEGRGESVWLAWFLIRVCQQLSGLAVARHDMPVAEELRRHARDYTTAVEAHGWDGAWYRRAYFDDGTPLGTASGEECRIDSIAQSWSVISGAGRPERQQMAMASLREHLVREDDGIIALLTPPFDRGQLDPGYIKGYLPGVRENGAQYTHAALWAVHATTMLGDADQAWALYRMINPLSHTARPEDVATYQVEPYVVAADVYTAAGHVGRGGWTWYTGSASWMYRVGLESLLGFTKRGDRLTIIPCVPADWPEFSIDYSYGTSRYRITVRAPGKIRTLGSRIELDGVVLHEDAIPLRDDGTEHRVVIVPRDADTLV